MKWKLKIKFICETLIWKCRKQLNLNLEKTWHLSSNVPSNSERRFINKTVRKDATTKYFSHSLVARSLSSYKKITWKFTGAAFCILFIWNQNTHREQFAKKTRKKKATSGKRTRTWSRVPSRWLFLLLHLLFFHYTRRFIDLKNNKKSESHKLWSKLAVVKIWILNWTRLNCQNFERRKMIFDFWISTIFFSMKTKVNKLVASSGLVHKWRR